MAINEFNFQGSKFDRDWVNILTPLRNDSNIDIANGHTADIGGWTLLSLT